MLKRFIVWSSADRSNPLRPCEHFVRSTDRKPHAARRRLHFSVRNHRAHAGYALPVHVLNVECAVRTRARTHLAC